MMRAPRETRVAGSKEAPNPHFRPRGGMNFERKMNMHFADENDPDGDDYEDTEDEPDQSDGGEWS